MMTGDDEAEFRRLMDKGRFGGWELGQHVYVRMRRLRFTGKITGISSSRLGKIRLTVNADGSHPWSGYSVRSHYATVSKYVRKLPADALRAMGYYGQPSPLDTL